MSRIRKGIRTDLAELFQKNVPEILYYIKCTRNELAKECGLSRQAICNILNNEDHHITGVQFLGIMQALSEMIARFGDDDMIMAQAAYAYWTEVNDFYRVNGIKMAEIIIEEE